MNTRLEQFLAAENISQAEFADTIGVARASVSHIIAGRNKPSFDFISGMMLRYPRLNMEWLLVGKGKMYKDPMVSPAPASPVDVPETEPDLFSISPREEPVAAPVDDRVPDPAFPATNPPFTNLPENTDNQRKISKIIVFYDDNTFQELS